MSNAVIARILHEARLHKGCKDERIYNYLRDKIARATESARQYEEAIHDLCEILGV